MITSRMVTWPGLAEMCVCVLGEVCIAEGRGLSGEEERWGGEDD